LEGFGHFLSCEEEQFVVRRLVGRDRSRVRFRKDAPQALK
jgi:hypothetical protein